MPDGTAEAEAPCPRVVEVRRRVVRVHLVPKWWASAKAAVTTSVVTACILIAPDRAAAQSTYAVPGDYATIQAAIDAAVDGDTIQVAPGTYREAINLGVKGITLESTGGASVTTIHGQLDAGNPATKVPTVVYAGPGQAAGAAFATIRGFTITGGSGGSAGDGSSTSAFVGGGVFLDKSDARLEACIVTGNSAEHGGGVYINRGAATVIDCVVSSNSATLGGGMYIYSAYAPTTLTQTRIENNVASDKGGGVIVFYGQPAISYC